MSTGHVSRRRGAAFDTGVGRDGTDRGGGGGRQTVRRRRRTVKITNEDAERFVDIKRKTPRVVDVERHSMYTRVFAPLERGRIYALICLRCVYVRKSFLGFPNPVNRRESTA
jgi:hypothetical protein